MRGLFVFACAGAALALAAAVPLNGQMATDACAILTSAQVSAVLGAPVGDGEHVPATNPLSCRWSPRGVTGPSGKRALLDLLGPIGKLTPADRFDKGKRPLTGAAPTPLADVGDEAYYVTTPGTGTALNVKSGTVVFQLRVYGFTPDEVRAMEKSLAEAILGKP